MKSARAQADHDLVVDRIKEWLVRKHPADYVWTNPGQEKNHEVDGFWPDVVLTARGGRVRAVYEVETADTVVEDRTAEQWVELSMLDVPLNLVVPEDSVRVVKKVMLELGIRVEQLILY